MAARERSPPPRWTVPGNAAAMLATRAACTGSPVAGAVQVDHVQRRRALRRRSARAWATGSSLKTVDWAKSPWRRRTAWPPWRSIAG